LRSYKRTPAEDEWASSQVRCSVCRTYNDIRTRPRGGKYEPKLEAVSGASSQAGQDKTIYDADGGQGCSFCLSPEWADGGKAGDLIPPF